MSINFYDIINKKKHGKALTKEEIIFTVSEYTEGRIPDYQMSSLLMAICIRGMNDEETAHLTEAMAKSGDMLDLSVLGSLSVDKHSTGGVGDKTTLIAAPIAASLGCKVAKMSGRGLGHTGGTVDKLESIPGYRITLTDEEFISQIDRIGIAVIGQSKNLAPADKKIYALRDVTATVDSMPLITASIMSKKLAAGTKNIVLDVKYGNGAFMKTPEDALLLGKKMIEIGTRAKRNVSALITNMDTPLGREIGNISEIREAIDTLCKRGPDDLTDISISIAAQMTSLSLGIEEEKAHKMAKDALYSGAAFEKFKEWIAYQGGDVRYIDTPQLFDTPKYERIITADRDGYISALNAESIGRASVLLGAGRERAEDKIDYTAGISLLAKCGDKVARGDAIMRLYTSLDGHIPAAVDMAVGSITISEDPPELPNHIYAHISSADRIG